MNTPDLSQDRELAALAEVMREAHLAKMAERGCPVQLYNSEYLAMADAARTHLGSGYTLPEANEENAERLERAMVDHGLVDDYRDTHDLRMHAARKHLRALHAAFPPPDKHAPTGGPDYTTTDDVAEALRKEEKPVREPRRVLFTALASNPKLLEVLLNHEADHARVKTIRYWAGIFEEAAC